MNRVFTLAGLILMAGAAHAQTIRVGMFQKPSVVVAFYRSPVWSETIQAKRAEMEAAKKAGDTRKAEELEKWGQNQQELAHRQLAGEAPIANILEMLAPAFPEIARKAQVSLIAADMPYAAPGVLTVDVTDQLLDWLKADERTRSIVRDLQNRPGPVH